LHCSSSHCFAAVLDVVCFSASFPVRLLQINDQQLITYHK
jgi:hypothetical protein